MKSTEIHIAADWLSKLTATKGFSKYSPTLEWLAEQCSSYYPKENGVGTYKITAQHILMAAEELGLQLKESALGTLVAVQVLELKHSNAKSVFCQDSICRHGFAPYTFVATSASGPPAKKLICSKCPGGFKAPSASDVQAARDWLAGKSSSSSPSSGALLIAANKMNFNLSKTTSSNFHASKVGKST